jgi:hypothetical protein
MDETKSAAPTAFDNTLYGVTTLSVSDLIEAKPKMDSVSCTTEQCY